MKLIMKFAILIVMLSLISACGTKVKKGEQSLAIGIEKRAEDYYKDANLLLAESEYRELLKVAPRYSKAWFRLGNIYMRTNQLDAAITHYEKALVFEPKHAKAWHNLALARIRQATNVLVEGQRRVESSQSQEIDFLLKKLLSVQRAD